jgi:putative heme iron utilization protein
VDVYYVGGFGVMGWVSASEYRLARPDPLADSMTEIIEHMNADHHDAIVLLARTFAGIDAQEAAMTSIDRLGFHVRLTTPDGVRGARIGLLREANGTSDIREVLKEMVQRARENRV